MPSSVKDRFTVDYEHIFFFVKRKKYYFHQVFDPFRDTTMQRIEHQFNKTKSEKESIKVSGVRRFVANVKAGRLPGRNRRAVWDISTKAFHELHFAVYPPSIPARCIEAGCPQGGVVLDPFFGSGTTGYVAKKMGCRWIGIELNPAYCVIAKKRVKSVPKHLFLEVESENR